MASSPKPRPSKVVNWDKPPVKDAVERAYEDGITDPAAIARWAKERFDMDLTTDEITAIIADLKPNS